MIKRLKIARLKEQIIDICSQNGYELIGDIRKCSIGESSWTFAVKTPYKTFLVKLIVPFGSNNTGLCINSPTYISAMATLLGMKGIMGSINIPITREYKFKLPKTAFGLDSDNCEKIFLIYPKCAHFSLRQPDNPYHLIPFRVGLKCGDIQIHDGASFKHLLENPNETRKFAKFGE